MRKKVVSQEKAITLIALVITIVVLIILATITISITFGEGGLIDRAQQAKELTEEGKQSEQKELNDVMSFIGSNGVFNNNNISGGEIQEPSGPKPEILIDIVQGDGKVTIVVTATEEENGIESIKLIDQEDEREISSGSGTAEESFDVYENGTYTIEVTTTTGATETETIEITTIESDAVVRMDGTDYETLRAAIEAAPQGQNKTIELLKDYNQTVVAEVPSGKEITLDLKNYTMTLTTGALRNCGKLEIKTSDASQAGKINMQNQNYTGIYNNGGELQISSGTYNTNVAVNTIQNTGKMAIVGGQINGTTIYADGTVYPTVWNSENSELTINGGTVSATTGPCIMNASNGTITVDGGTLTANGSISASGGNTIYNLAIQNSADGIVTIDSGTVQVQAANAIGNYGQGSVIINGGQIIGATETTAEGQSFPTINNVNGTIQVNNGATVGSTTSIALYNIQNGTISINGGNVTSTIAAAILNAGGGNVSIANGTINSTQNVAIQNDGSGDVTIQGGTITTVSAPALLNRANGTITTSANVQATNYSAIQNGSIGTITINGGEVKGALQISEDGYFPTVTNSSTGTINVTGGTVGATAGVALYNGGTGDIVVDGATITGAGVAGAVNIGTGDFIVKSGSINTSDVVALQNNDVGNVYIEGGSITSTSGVSLINAATGNITVSGGFVQSQLAFSIANLTDGTINVSGGEVKGATSTNDQEQTYSTIFNQANGNITVAGSGYVEATTGMSILNPSVGTANVNGGTVIADVITVANTGTGNINITNGLVQSNYGHAIANSSSGKVTVSGGEVISQIEVRDGNNYPVIWQSGTGEIIVTGGSVIGKSENIAIKNDINGRVTVTGGLIQANCQAMENETGGGGVITIGVDDGVVSTTSPVVSAPNTYLAAWGETVNYYDGLLKGAGLSSEYATINVPSGWSYYRDDSKNPPETTLRQN